MGCETSRAKRAHEAKQKSKRSKKATRFKAAVEAWFCYSDISTGVYHFALALLLCCIIVATLIEWVMGARSKCPKISSEIMCWVTTCPKFIWNQVTPIVYWWLWDTKWLHWRDWVRRGNFEQQLKKHPRWDQVEVACYIYARRNYTTFRYPQKLPLPPSATSKWARAWVILSPRKTNDKTAVHNYSCARAMLSKISFHNRHSFFVCAPSR